MKGTKILTSISALLLVLGVGGCAQAENEQETAPSDTEKEVNIIENYKVSFMLTEGSRSTSIPDYATAYIIGDWDSWGSFIELTKESGMYTYTFPSISEGEHEYKGVMWYKDQEVSWDNCVELITADDGGNALLTVSEADGGSQIIHVEYKAELDPPMSDDEITETILRSVSQYENADKLNFGAYLAKQVSEDETNTYYMGTDSSGKCYGLWSIEDADGLTNNYIKDGIKYIDYTYEENKDDRFVKSSWNESYTYFIEDWSESFTLVKNFFNEEDELVEDALNQYMSTLTSSRSSYTLVLSNQNDGKYEYSFTTDLDFNISAVTYYKNVEDEISSWSIEKITDSELKKYMSSFNLYNWEVPEDVEAMLDAISNCYNYTLEIEYYEIYSDIFFDEEDLEEHWEEDLEYLDYKVVIYFTEDAFFIYYYFFYNDAWTLWDIELYVNDYENERTKYYMSLSEDYLIYYAYYNGYWQDVFTSYTLTSLMPYSENFIKGEQTSGEYGTEYSYTLGGNMDITFIDLLIASLFGGYNYYYYEGLVGGPSTILALASTGGTIYFNSTYYSDIGRWDATLASGPVEWTDSSYGDFVVCWYEEDTMMASVYDIGNTSIPERYASYLS